MKQTRHVGQVRDGEIVWSYYKARQDAIGAIPDGTWISETIKPVGKPITMKQMAYYYAVVLPITHKQLVEDGHEVMGVPITLEMTDNILKHYCSDGLLKRNMSIEDGKKFIGNCIRWTGISLGCIIPEPDKNWYNENNK